MDGNLNQLARELRENPALVESIMRSRDGQDLLRLLNRQGDGFQRAAESAARGDSAEMARRIRQIAQSPDGAAIVERIQRAFRK